MVSLPEEFNDLDYPGRRRPKNRSTQPPPDKQVWDDKPLHYLVNGEKREFFIIGHLAKALDYSVQSIRACRRTPSWQVRLIPRLEQKCFTCLRRRRLDRPASEL